jgi:hypothetical protein
MYLFLLVKQLLQHKSNLLNYPHQYPDKYIDKINTKCYLQKLKVTNNVYSYNKNEIINIF